jgi:hypothetical protein
MTSQPTLAGPPEPFRTNTHDPRLVERIAKWWKLFCRKKKRRRPQRVSLNVDFLVYRADFPKVAYLF